MARAGNRCTMFVTVGTTLFDALIAAATTEEALNWMASHGYTHLILQYGKGTPPVLPEKDKLPDTLLVESYAFKSSLAPDMEQADLILSHAGAGTVTEALRLGKRMVVVINTILMHNHQTELANAMGSQSRQHLFVVQEPEQLAHMETWNAFQEFVPVPNPAGDDYHFPRLLDSFMGIQDSKES
jgi:beta-1,4-N-acetylglucosaminyltransferase